MSEPIYDARTLWELLERRVADSPDRSFLIDDADRTVTFSEAKEQAARRAAGGADVSKIEAPEGDAWRYNALAPAQDDLESPAFEVPNRGKRSVVLNLKEPAQQAQGQQGMNPGLP